MVLVLFLKMTGTGTDLQRKLVHDKREMAVLPRF